MQNLYDLVMACAFVTFVATVCTNEWPRPYWVDYDEVTEHTIDAWETVIGPITNRCYERVHNTRVGEATVFPDSCVAGKGKHVIGCHFGGSNLVLISAEANEKQKARIAVHEFIHAIAICELGVADGDHSDARLWDEYGDQTVEVIGVNKIGGEQ